MKIELNESAIANMYQMALVRLAINHGGEVYIKSVLEPGKPVNLEFQVVELDNGEYLRVKVTLLDETGSVQ